MSFLQRARSLPVPVQIAAAAVLTITICTLLTLAYIATRPEYEVLFRDLRPADAATIVEELERQGTPYRLDDDGSTILTPSSVTDRTRISLMSTDLPLKGTVGFELFNKSDLGLTEFAQRINYQRALQGELERTIMQLSGVEHARVHLTLPKASIFREDQEPTKASVTLITLNSLPLDDTSIAGIRRLVAAAVAGLAPADVVITDQTGAEIGKPVAPITAGAAAQANPETRLLQSIEDFYSAQLTSVVGAVYPGTEVTAQIPLDQWADLSGGSSARSAALNSWTPDDRAFRLSVTVSSATEIDQTTREEIALLVTSAIAWSSTAGDTLYFAQALPGESETAAESRTIQPSPPTRDQTDVAPMSDNSRLGWVVPVLLVLVLLLVLGLARQAYLRPRRLTAVQQDAYAAKLKRLIERQAHDEA